MFKASGAAELLARRLRSVRSGPVGVALALLVFTGCASLWGFTGVVEGGDAGDADAANGVDEEFDKIMQKMDDLLDEMNADDIRAEAKMQGN